MNLIIDHGNTRTKTAVFDSNSCVFYKIFEGDFTFESLVEIVQKFQCKNAIFSGVGSVDNEQIEALKNHLNLIVLDAQTAVPFENKYESPETLGVDRIALAAAAINKFPGKNVLVIDAGTCITYDFINENGVYKGGAISPGITMRYKALNAYTDRLPLLKKIKYAKLIGGSTEKSIHSGVLNGVIGEIDNAIKKYKKKNKDLTIVLTGGDVNFLANSLKNGIFANPIFLLEGLNTILTYNLV